MRFQSEKIRAILNAGGFRGKAAILSLPAAATFLQPIKVPVGPPDEVDGAVRKQLSGKLSYPVGSAVVRHVLAGMVYGGGGEMQERIVVAVPRSELDAHISMADRAGLEVTGVNVEACAVVECFSRLFRRTSDGHRVTLFIDIGAASTQVVLAQGSKMIFAHNLPLGGQDLDREVAEALKIPIEQARGIRLRMNRERQHTAAEDDLFRLLEARVCHITDEIAQCLRYCESLFTNHAIECVVFVGGQSNDRRLCQGIAERLGLPAKVGDPMAGIVRSDQAEAAFGPDGGRPQPAWAVAIGLSLGASVSA